ncbi:hypothetical protein H5410_005019 [Solanum commersonii]|uniref:DUF4283 domain-containing protein n=1 Tax=Solanum commersonii TaxID=4109 RepID=A0A9J6A5I3_SOLCO|nr:hypothetical protein H5410_005019 [Solanum commersonii]
MSTTSMTRISYARVRIYGEFQQDVEYEWRPRHCVECIRFGHTNENCWNKEEGREDDEKEARPTPYTGLKGKRYTNTSWRSCTQIQIVMEGQENGSSLDGFSVLARVTTQSESLIVNVPLANKFSVLIASVNTQIGNPQSLQQFGILEDLTSSLSRRS